MGEKNRIFFQQFSTEKRTRQGYVMHIRNIMNLWKNTIATNVRGILFVDMKIHTKLYYLNDFNYC